MRAPRRHCAAATAFYAACAPPHSFLRRHEDELGALPGKTLQELRLASKPLLTLPASTPALHVFAAMARARVSAAGITSAPGGPLVANLSASDLRGLTAEDWGRLALPVTAFLVRQCGQPVPTAALDVPLGAGGAAVYAGSVESTPGAGAELSAVLPLHAVRPSAHFSQARAVAAACCRYTAMPASHAAAMYAAAAS